MHCAKSQLKKQMHGSVLIYVLWILVLISTLAIQLTSNSRVIILNQSAVSTQLKNQMQIDSAVQFALHKIIANQWENRKFEFNLNGQQIRLKVFNEIGFISLYQLDEKLKKKLFNAVNLPETARKMLENIIQSEDIEKFNDFNELLQFDGIDNDILVTLILVSSIFNDDYVNPNYSPEEVLILLPGIDQFRVEKLREAKSEKERQQLRNQIVDSLSFQDTEFSSDLLNYYRVYVSLDEQRYVVFLKYNSRKNNYRVMAQLNVGLDQFKIK